MEPNNEEEGDPNVVYIGGEKKISRHQLIQNTRERFYKNLSKKLAKVQADLGMIGPDEIKEAEEKEKKNEFYERLYQ
jgi:hypothetical protein